MAEDFCGQNMTISVQTGKFQGMEIPQLGREKAPPWPVLPAAGEDSSIFGYEAVLHPQGVPSRMKPLFREVGEPRGLQRSENLQLDLMEQDQLSILL